MKSPLHRAVRPVRHWRSKKTLSQEIKSAYRLLLNTVLILGLATSGIYLYVNSLKPAKGYLLNELQANYNSLESTQRKLNQEVIEAQSFIHIQESNVRSQMEISQNSETAYLNTSSVADARTNNSAD